MKKVETFITREMGYDILNFEITLTRDELENEHFKEKGEAKLILKRRMIDIKKRNDTEITRGEGTGLPPIPPRKGTSPH